MKCIFGFHDWQYKKPIHGNNYNLRLGIFIKQESRECRRCGITQVKKPIRKDGKKTHRWLTYKL